MLKENENRKENKVKRGWCDGLSYSESLVKQKHRIWQGCRRGALPYGNQRRRALNVWTGWLCGVIYVLPTQIIRNILNRMSHSTRAGREKVHLRWINLHGSAVTSHDTGLKPGSAAPRKARLLLTVSDWSALLAPYNKSCVIGRARTRSPRTYKSSNFIGGRSTSVISLIRSDYRGSTALRRNDWDPCMRRCTLTFLFETTSAAIVVLHQHQDADEINNIVEIGYT